MTIAKGNPMVQPFIITRTFEAPRALVWKAWTERERLRQWFGPKGFTMTDAKLDLRPGGTLHYCLRAPDGKEMWGRFVYRQYRSRPSGLSGSIPSPMSTAGLTRHPFARAAWPLEMLSTATFADVDGKTKLTVEWSPLNPTDEERQTFDASHASMTQGWTGTFDQLVAYLASRKPRPLVPSGRQNVGKLSRDGVESVPARFRDVPAASRFARALQALARVRKRNLHINCNFLPRFAENSSDITGGNLHLPKTTNKEIK